MFPIYSHHINNVCLLLQTLYTVHCPNVVSMLDQCRRPWSTIEVTLGQCIVLFRLLVTVTSEFAGVNMTVSSKHTINSTLVPTSGV